MTAAAGPAPGTRPFAALETLQRLSYVEAVLWIGARLADGLAHAHEHGIVHLDIKPANILLTDEGQPMLLDFNLSEDTKRCAPARVGGTLAYMAPEHLETFRQKSGQVDVRSDIYSLGVVLYELLTGRHPFPPPSGPLDQVLPHLIEQRRQQPPQLRCWNKAVSPTSEAIIRRCLEPGPHRRYPSADALQQDLDRHLEHLPLLHTREPSFRERLGKWVKRHPRLTSGGTVAAAAAVLLLALGTALAVLWQRHLGRQAMAALEQFRQEKVVTDFTLGVRGDRRRGGLEEGIRQGRRALSSYGILENPRWQDAGAVRRLPAREREELREQAADLLWSLARATAQQSGALPGAGRQEHLLTALALNHRAAEALPDGQVWRALWLQRADLAARLGRPEEATSFQEKAAQTSFVSARDRFLAAIQLREEGRSQMATNLLKEATRLLVEETGRNPRDFLGWFLRASCHDLLQQNAEALTCYTVCIALNPESPECYFNRGLVYSRQRRWENAGTDFDRVIALREDLPEAHAQRGLAARERGDYQAAERDLTRALELGPSQTRFFFLRAAVREKVGNVQGARLDREEGLSREPGDEASWVERGIARLPRDPHGALADFEQALRLEPRYVPAWQDKAHVLSDHLGRNEDALKAIDQVVALRPDFVPGRLGRGVLLARLGKRDAAHREAREALDRDASPATLYQAANIYALTSRQKADDRVEALPLLARALAGGFGLDVIDRDTDMDPIRNHPEFRRLVQAARDLRDGGGKKSP